MIVVGKILDGLGAVVRTRLHQPELVPIGNFRYRKPPAQMRTTCTLEPLELRSAQSAHVPVTINHDQSAVVGAVRHLEHGGNAGDYWAVCDLDTELPDDITLFFSIQGDGRDRYSFELRSLGITTDPASVGLGPVRMLDGDVAGSERLALQLKRSEPHLSGLLQRARAATKARRRGEALVVEDRCRHRQEVVKLEHGAGYLVDGELVPASHRSGRFVTDPETGQTMPLEIRPGGRILSVNGRPPAR